MDKSCFANCKKLKKVELPTTLKSIGEICFFGCSNVTVTIKGKITKCDVYAFYKVRNCKIVLKTAAAKKGKKVLAKALKKGKNKTKHHCQKNCKSKSCFGSINYSCSFFFRSDLRKCNLKSLKADCKPKKIYRKDQLINSNLMCTNHPCKKYSIIESNEP